MRAGPRRSEGLICSCQCVSVNRPRESEPENKPGKMRISSFHVYTIRETSVQSEWPSFATFISCLACSLIREFSMNCYCRITAYLIRNSGRSRSALYRCSLLPEAFSTSSFTFFSFGYFFPLFSRNSMRLQRQSGMHHLLFISVNSLSRLTPVRCGAGSLLSVEVFAQGYRPNNG